MDVWRVRLDQRAATVERLAATLSEDERARADRAATELARRHFVVARGALRAILARYLDVAPDALRFGYSERGKPTLVGSPGLRFNASHSHGLALVAVARGREVGVDLERVRPLPNAEQLARRFFSPAEQATLAALPASDRQEAFLHAWTRKEALLKATGGGLGWGRALRKVEVALGAQARLLGPDAERWQLVALAPGRGYVGALAVEGAACAVRHQRWTP